MNGRIYDPQLGRFLSPDPVVDGVLSFQGYNRYSYVSNNPLTYTDPTGLWKLLVGGGSGWAGLLKIEYVDKELSLDLTLGLGVGGLISFTPDQEIAEETSQWGDPIDLSGERARIGFSGIATGQSAMAGIGIDASIVAEVDENTSALHGEGSASVGIKGTKASLGVKGDATVGGDFVPPGSFGGESSISTEPEVTFGIGALVLVGLQGGYTIPLDDIDTDSDTDSDEDNEDAAIIPFEDTPSNFYDAYQEYYQFYR